MPLHCQVIAPSHAPSLPHHMHPQCPRIDGSRSGDAQGLRADGRATVVWTLDEVASMIDGQHFVQSVKRAFPGASVVAARTAITDPLRGVDAVGPLDDPIPF